MEALYKIANLFFFVFHVALILFNLFGWIFKPLQKWNLLTLGLTTFSWVGLGFFYGFGYCFLTDWHWQVREELGYAITSHSYIHFLITTLFPISISERAVDILTVILFLVAVCLSLYANGFIKIKRGSV